MVPIRVLRQAYGLSAPQLAARLRDEEGVKVDPDSILNIELGHKRASQPLLAAWARVLRITSLDVHQPEELRERLDDASCDQETAS